MQARGRPAPWLFVLAVGLAATSFVDGAVAAGIVCLLVAGFLLVR